MAKSTLLKKVKLPARFSFLGYMGDVQGCGTLRVIIPYLLLNHYRSHKGKVACLTTFLHNFIPDPDFYKNFTFCQFQRSASESHLKIFHHFKTKIQTKYNVPIIYEIDDMLIGIPDWNYASNYYKKNEDYVKKMIEISDAVMVSTPYLQKVYGEFNKNIHVQPNRLTKMLWGDIYPAHEYKDENEKVKILWAGSQNHFANPMVTGEAKGGDFGQGLMDFIIKTVDKYDWYFVGAMPMELSGIKNKINFVPWVDVLHYPSVVKNLECDIGIAPLMDNSFNAAKSNIKQLEYVACGMPGVYSQVEPYANCYCTVKNEEQMIDQIEKLAGDIDLRAEYWAKDYERVRNDLFWEDSGNIGKYLKTYLRAFGQRLP